MKRTSKQISPMEFFSALRWIDKRPLLDVIEDYRRRIFEEALFTFDADGRPRYDMVLCGRGKKNWKSCDAILACLYRLLAWHTVGGNDVYCLANDLGQAKDNLALAKKLIAVNPVLSEALRVKQEIAERRDGQGFLQVLPAQDVAGTHGKSFLMVAYDEIHSYRDWSLIEALQPDPTRTDVLQWICSYASLYDRPGAPLHDLCQAGWKSDDARMYFDWHSATKCTDPACDNLSPEEKANPSRQSWKDQNYLAQQKKRLPFHKYRRLHLNLGGQPEGSALNAEKIEQAIERGVKLRPPVDGIEYAAFVDMSGGSNDDACLSIAHREGEDGRAVLDYITNQGGPCPFDPRQAVTRFAAILKNYRCFSVTGDKYAGETFIQDFEREGIAYRVSELTTSQLYEAMEPRLNSGAVVLLDEPKMESQLLGLVWRASKIDHVSNEHDDFANSCAGAIHAAFEGAGAWKFESFGRPAEHLPAWGDPTYGGEREQTLANYVDGIQDDGGGMSIGRGGNDDPFSAW